MTSSHDHIKDIRNQKIKIFVNQKFFSRNKAKLTVLEQVSVSDYLKREFNYSFWILKII